MKQSKIWMLATILTFSGLATLASCKENPHIGRDDLRHIRALHYIPSNGCCCLTSMMLMTRRRCAN